MPSKLAGGFLRLFTTFLYILAFCCAAVGLGIYSYFLARLAKHDLPISTTFRAIEGLTGSGVLYTIFAVLLTCFLGGIGFFAILGVILDLLFCGVFIAVAVLTRQGASACKGIVQTPLGTGRDNADTSYGANYGLACRLNTAVFATACIAAFLFLLCAIFQVFMMMHHKKEKKYGPSPKNNYTSGSGSRKFWKRKPKTTREAYGTDTELAPNGHGRPSHETGYTGTTAAPSHVVYGEGDKYGSTNGTNGINGTHGTHGRYENTEAGYTNSGVAGHVHEGPGPTAGVNPYGYSNTTHPTGTAVNY